MLQISAGAAEKLKRLVAQKGGDFDGIKVFDPPMCCSTGICGPSVNPELVRFAADLDWLKGEGVEVRRANLAQQPFDFTGDPAVHAALKAKGVDVLPIVKVAGEIRSQGRYPTRDELAGWAGLTAPASGRPADPEGQRPAGE
jgi:hypothetical protein